MTKYFILCSLLSCLTLPVLANKRETLEIVVPKKFESRDQWPLLISMHGYSGNIKKQNKLFRLKSHVNSLGFVLINISGIKNSKNKRFWNASNFCCDFEGTKIDDLKYIQKIINYAKEEVGRIDEKRIYLHGHSNGGFMAFRAVCELNNQIAGVITVAASMDLRDENGDLIGESACKKTNPTSVIHLHGTKDKTILFDGVDRTNVGHLSAPKLVNFWSTHNGCQKKTIKPDLVDGDYRVFGKQTEISSWTDCTDRTEVWLYRLNGSGHVPFLKKPLLESALSKLFTFSL